MKKELVNRKFTDKLNHAIADTQVPEVRLEMDSTKKHTPESVFQV